MKIGWSLFVILAVTNFGEGKAKLACWETERFEIENACRACRSKGDNQRICAETGFIEKVKCNSGQIEARSCTELPADQKKKFIKFELFCALFGTGCAYFTFQRMRQLDREHDERIKKQLSSL
ncbi:Oidioi.mRNA.OKI2018_I69.XSR.g16928.t1.cds [Oikopleura dioica]|uniref:Oidioi.mRNA.OKI2018_I69.XSR.g16928.t1.cds n=1 Tax=Oikopleura dioica TaxID=34765 RepID=A0ABN7SNY4_OIKDI|nr:Oidioi.mRNA.OKI2018_I69.XSR.g16928.t1.cds [Oikopleura dioica]